MYRVGDLDTLKGIPGVDWVAVRATKPGRPSPLRAFAQLAPQRTAVVRAFNDELRETCGLPVWARFANLDNHWLIDWEPGPDGSPSRDDVAALLADNPAASRFADGIQLLSAQGKAIHWARQMLQPGAAVVLDTETHALWGRLMEVAVVDAATGEVLLESLANPQIPVTEDAFDVHPISDAMVADAPTWDEVPPELLRVTAGRKMLAYNAEYDKTVIVGDCLRVEADPQHLRAKGQWGVHHAPALRLVGRARLPAAGRRAPCPWRYVRRAGDAHPRIGPGVSAGAYAGEGQRLNRRRTTREAGIRSPGRRSPR
ncbi:3'-5' exonuclease [Streptomyces acidicola]|uniref:3'-5' exonuclease n=1 Tax=Streptomyces acidicola TaxID=2596892 RepID=UPI0034445023